MDRIFDGWSVLLGTALLFFAIRQYWPIPLPAANEVPPGVRERRFLQVVWIFLACYFILIGLANLSLSFLGYGLSDVALRELTWLLIAAVGIVGVALAISAPRLMRVMRYTYFNGPSLKKLQMAFLVALEALAAGLVSAAVEIAITSKVTTTAWIVIGLFSLSCWALSMVAILAGGAFALANRFEREMAELHARHSQQQVNE